MISVKNAPRYLYLITALKNTLFILPVVMMYYGYKGVGQGDFYLIQGLCYLMVFVLEIPTGYIGDVFSRKNTLIFGTIAWIIGYACWLFGVGFWWILAGELTFALAISLVSGTIDAYLYDLLKKRNKEHQFHKKMAKKETYGNVGLLLATLSGALVYNYIGADETVELSIIMLAVALGILFIMPDVPESKRKIAKDKSKFQDIMEISKSAVKNKEIKWLMLFSAIYGSLTLILMWGLQSVMIERHIPVVLFGVVVGINAFCRTVWSAVAGKALEKYGLNKIIIFLIIVIFTASSGAASAVWVPHFVVYVCLALMILGSGSIQLVRVVVSTLINHRIQSDERATVISVKSMADRSLAGLCMILLKPLFDKVGVGETYLIALILLIPIVLSAYQLGRLKLEMKK